jgi:hypothetical protein
LDASDAVPPEELSVAPAPELSLELDAGSSVCEPVELEPLVVVFDLVVEVLVAVVALAAFSAEVSVGGVISGALFG